MPEVLSGARPVALRRTAVPPAPRVTTTGREIAVAPKPNDSDSSVRVSIVIPCLNEADTIDECVRRAWHALNASQIAGEVIVADNGSEDGSGGLAAAAGAMVVYEPERGYGVPTWRAWEQLAAATS